MPPRLLASTHTFLWTASLQTAADEIARAGYAGIELMAAPAHVRLQTDHEPDVAAIREAVRRSGTVISGLATGFDANLASPDGSMRDWSVKHYLAAGRLAASLGAAYLVVQPGRLHPFKPAPYDAARGWVIDGLAQIAATLREQGVRPVLENTPTGILDTAAECVEVVRAVGGERIGVCYDVANGLMVEDPADGLRSVSGDLDVIHLADTTRAEWRHDAIGSGMGDFAGLSSVVDEIGYGGPVVVETIHRTAQGKGLEADRLALHEAHWRTQGAARRDR